MWNRAYVFYFPCVTKEKSVRIFLKKKEICSRAFEDKADGKKFRWNIYLLPIFDRPIREVRLRLS